MWIDVRSGASTGSSDMPPDKRARAEQLIEEFEVNLENIVKTSNIPRRIVRPLAIGSVVCGLCDNTYFVGYLPHMGIPLISFVNLQAAGPPSIVKFHSSLADITAQDFAVVELSDFWVDLPQDKRKSFITAVAIQLAQAELSRSKVNTAMIPFNPIFGPNIFPLQEQLVFTLMPFTDELTTIYNHIIKPMVESKNLVSRRADDISSNNAIMQDIWKNICESRFIITDITGRNPNVMYELGIAHTVGKEVILIHQEGEEEKFPFDIAHMRVITYHNTATGGDMLKKKLEATIDSVMQKLMGNSIIN